MIAWPLWNSLNLRIPSMWSIQRLVGKFAYSNFIHFRHILLVIQQSVPFQIQIQSLRKLPFSFQYKISLIENISIIKNNRTDIFSCFKELYKFRRTLFHMSRHWYGLHSFPCVTFSTITSPTAKIPLTHRIQRTSYQTSSREESARWSCAPSNTEICLGS